MKRGAHISLRGVSKEFFAPDGSSVAALKSVSLEIGSGTLAVIGPSGSGKTTLLSLCSGLDRPSRGGIYDGDDEISLWDEKTRARWRLRKVGFVFQNFQLMPSLTALENALLPSRLCGGPVAMERARSLLDRLGVGPRAKHYPHQLSGGEQQRVALARALILNPSLILCDEPTGNLDEKSAELVITELFQHQVDTGAALVMVTHNLGIARRCQSMIEIRNGMLIQPAASLAHAS